MITSIFIDFNDNNVFEEHEGVLTNYQNPWGWGQSTTNLTVPYDANPGLHRMRVKGAFYQNTNNACGTINHGQTLDFLVNISNGTTPFARVNNVSEESEENVNFNSPLASEIPPQEEIEAVIIEPTSTEVIIYPNPSSGLFTVSGLNNYVKQQIEIKVLDLSGRLILNNHYNSDIKEVVLDLTTYPVGSYIVNIYLDGEYFKSERLFLNR